MEVWELSAFCWMANVTRKTQFKGKERRTREAERETIKKKKKRQAMPRKPRRWKF